MGCCGNRRGGRQSRRARTERIPYKRDFCESRPRGHNGTDLSCEPLSALFDTVVRGRPVTNLERGHSFAQGPGRNSVAMRLGSVQCCEDEARPAARRTCGSPLRGERLQCAQ